MAAVYIVHRMSLSPHVYYKDAASFSKMDRDFYHKKTQ